MQPAANPPGHVAAVGAADSADISRGARAECEVLGSIPVNLIVSALRLRAGVVRDLILFQTGRLQQRNGGGILLPLCFGGHGTQFILRSPTIEIGALFKGQPIRGNMADRQAGSSRQCVTPRIHRLSGDSENQIQGDIGDDLLAASHDFDGFVRGVSSFQSLQHCGIERLDTQTDSIHAAIAQDVQSFRCQPVRIGFHRVFTSGRQRERICN